MTAIRTTACLLVALLCATAAVQASNRYDPRLRFRTITTAHFDIHFHQGEESQARRLAAIAEEVADILEGRLGRPSGRVNVILVDQSDLSNGWATPVPFNLIEISAASPGGESLIGNTDDWLRLVFTHEYTHVVHLSRSRGWFSGLRRVFGRIPLLFPNLFTPIWQIEGIATYGESAVTGGGRIHSGDFRLIAEHAAASAGFLKLDRVNGGLIAWPGGHAPYVYGGLFHDYLASKYGERSLDRLTDSTAGTVPYFGARAFRKVFGRSLGDLWNEFEAQSAAGAAANGASRSAGRLTHHGFTVVGPRFGPDGRLYYSTVNPHGFPALMSLAPGEDQPRKLTNKYLGSRLGMSGDEIVFDEFEVVEQVGLQSDLHAIDQNGRRRRLTVDARAAEPDVSADGRTVVFTIQRTDGRGLATMPMPGVGELGRATPLRDEPLTNYSSPRWSPDGRWIAAERRTVGGPSEIVVIDSASKSIRVLVTSPIDRSVSPAWTPDGRTILFARSSPSAPFEIRSVDLASGSVQRLNDTGPNAHSPAVSPDGKTLVFIGYTGLGDDLFSMPLNSAVWSPVEADGARPVAALPDPPAAESRSYSPASTLVPRFWTPTVESDAGELVIGAATGAYDALGRHAYGIEGGWSTSRARPDWQVAYAYDRWWPTLFADVLEDTDPFRDGEARTREANAGVFLPIRRVRWSQTVLAAFHASRDRLECSTCGETGRLEATRAAVRTGWLIDAARAYGYSISDEEGWSARVSTELTRAALGADGDGGAAILDLRGYRPLGRRHAVIAARAAGATAWGDSEVRRLFSATGSDAQPLGFEFGTDAIGLLRGASEGDVVGEHAFVANIDVRVPLWRIERGLGTLPVFARTVHGSVFVDVAHAWSGRFESDRIGRSVGVELSIDTVLGYVLPLTFTGGAAWRDVPGEERGVAVFGRVGRAF